VAKQDVLGVRVIGWLNRIVIRLMPLIVGLLVFALSFLVIPRLDNSPNPSESVSSDGFEYDPAPPGDSTAPREQPTVVSPTRDQTPDDGSNTPLIVLAVLSGLTAALGFRWRWPLFAVAAVGWLWLGIWTAPAAASYYAATKLRQRWHSIVFLIAALAVIIWPFARASFRNDLAVLSVVVTAMVVVLPYIAGLWVKARREVVAGLHERAARLELEQAVRAEQARTEERERIAREMHDVLAHRVSLMVLHAGALEVNAPDSGVAEEAALIRTTGRDALAELRQVLGVLRGGPQRSPVAAEQLAPQPVLSDVDRLLARARAAGLTVIRRDEGHARELPAAVERAAYRVIQEALTNVVKHAPGAATTLTLRQLPDALEVVVDSGPPPHRGDPVPSGFGLVGLRERVELLQGRFEARARLDGGFMVWALIPAGATA
jgi:signal transduction histidine kinase